MLNLCIKKRAASLLFLFSITALIGAVVFTSSCSESPAKHFKLSGMTMGTSYHITVLEPNIDNGEPKPTLDKKALQARIDLRLALLNRQMSTYIDNSELSQFNRAAVDQWMHVSPELFEILTLSLELGWLSNGAFDISVGPLVNLWGFGPGGDALKVNNTIPTKSQIDRTLANVGFQHLEFNIANNQVRKRRDIKLDLSAIAKGYGVDKLAELLLDTGYRHFMVEIGGELRVQGNSPRGTPWRIAIEQPGEGFGAVNTAISVSGVGIATSGDYRNYFELNGRRYSHTIDPTTGAPITHTLVSVTVVTDTAAYADGLATAISVMGAQAGLQLAEQQNLAVYVISKTDDGFEAIASTAFKPYLQ